MTLITNPLDEKQRTMKEIKIERRPGMPIFENPVYKIPSSEKQKHEEIKRMAWGLHKDFLLALLKDSDIDIENDQDAREKAWSFAEQFYKFAKEKQEGANED